MSKGLEALEHIAFARKDDVEIVRKELKALEILKKYEMVRYIEWFGLTKEEYDLLKEVLL